MNESSTIPSAMELRAAFAFVKGSNIPSIPDVIKALRSELRRPEPDFQRVADLVVRDPAIAGSILRIANSAEFGLMQTVESIRHALSLIGLRRLGNLVVGAALEHGMHVQSEAANSIWEDSLSAARVAMRIASQVDGLTTDEAYLTGLMHDCGAILLAERFSSYPEVMALQGSHPISGLDRENLKYGTNHTVIGFLFARHWGLSEDLARAVYLHHSANCTAVASSKLRALVATLKIANQLVVRHGPGDGEGSLESMQYLVNAKKELMLSEQALWDLGKEAFLGPN